ncbi:alpha/beta fold hydrolase [Amycolatopsis sp. CA-230715]|uniref:alpha/beta fold hydrolase n=1 Tax=Amycolatopsis sp. CA-230715 TaxID=2745196 RepID=UPI001C01D097|nr:alpha/beta hydrolase [Amycolatopsis sp. CA-230715]QWF79862.1 AB hydrolase superfamily protein YdjP [Amycolatopsis sp. CA-230715]
MRVNGRELHVADTGGDGPPVLLGHGYFLDHTVFDAQADALAPRWRVIRWDAPAHGESPDADGPFTYWDAARDVLAIMDELGLPAATIGGISQGGFIALRAALLAPDRVTGLVLMDTEATACDPEDKIAYQGLFDALRAAGPVDELTVPLSEQLLGDDVHAASWRQRWRDRASLPLGETARCLLDRDDVSGRLGEITCPALLLWGSRDRSLPRDRMELLRDRLPSATEVQVVDGAAHTPALTHPGQVTEALLTFLT